MIIIASKICQAPALGEVVSGLVATAGIYITGNVVTRWRAAAIEQAKVTAQQPTPEPPPKPPPKPPKEDVKPEDDMRG